MALRNFSGAEMGDFSECQQNTGTAPATIDSAVKRTGSYSYKFAPGGTAQMSFADHGANAKMAAFGDIPLWVTAYIRFADFPDSDLPILGIGASANGTSPVAQMMVDASGQVTIAGASTSSVIATLSTDTWYRVDLRAANNGTCGLAIDGGTELTVTGNAVAADYVVFGSVGSAITYTLNVDDVAIDDAAFIGDGQVAIIVPTGDSSTNTGWTASAGNKWDCINEVPPAGADYIASGTGAGDQRYSATHASAQSAGISGAIKAVKVVARLKEVTSTTTLGRIGIRSGSANYETTDVDIGTTTVITMAKIYNDDPATSAAWTYIGVNAAEPLVVRSTSDISDIRCEALYLMVWYVGGFIAEPGPFALQWTGHAPSLLLKDVVTIDRELQWRNGGQVTVSPEFQWRNGGTVSHERTLQWRVAPSPLRVHYALTGRSGPVTYTFRFERRTIANQFLEDVTPAFLGGSIEANNDRDVFRTATFTVDANAVDDRGNAVTIDPLADHIAVFMDLLVDGSYTLGLPMGLFALNVPRKRYEPGSETWEIAASDNGIHLMEATTTASYTVAAGANYITGTNAVRAILDNLGLAHGLPTTALTLPVARTWPAGTPWLRVVNDLLHAAGMYSLWFDATGIARTRAYDDLSTRTPDVTYTGDDFVLIPLTEEAETTRLANQVVAVVEDPSRAVLTSVKTNADPDSPISTTRLGRTITKVINSDAADQSTLDAIAENYLRTEAGLYRRATLLTSIDPRRDAREVYELSVDGVYAAERWWARNWRVQLTIGAQHQHTLGKVERVVAS